MRLTDPNGNRFTLPDTDYYVVLYAGNVGQIVPCFNMTEAALVEYYAIEFMHQPVTVASRASFLKFSAKTKYELCPQVIRSAALMVQAKNVKKIRSGSANTYGRRQFDIGATCRKILKPAHLKSPRELSMEIIRRGQ